MQQQSATTATIASVINMFSPLEPTYCLYEHSKMTLMMTYKQIIFLPRTKNAFAEFFFSFFVLDCTFSTCDLATFFFLQ